MIEEKAILAEPDQNTPRRIAEHILTQQIDITTQQERRVLLAKQLGSQPTILSEALDHKLEDRIDKSQRMYVRTQDRKECVAEVISHAMRNKKTLILDTDITLWAKWIHEGIDECCAPHVNSYCDSASIIGVTSWMQLNVLLSYQISQRSSSSPDLLILGPVKKLFSRHISGTQSLDCAGLNYKRQIELQLKKISYAYYRKRATLPGAKWSPMDLVLLACLHMTTNLNENNAL
ncbi:unnamed protein product [Albugo candida]|uniref:Uncharacterized protein n=1 Tax=Albugo candida TaxID=65357 RepID=A0A024GRE6_9STRA|nr:unnamed protein product [Albugo candida]|eukprot:CCI49458.1 unnamed protein product [Albugo candida]